MPSNRSAHLTGIRALAARMLVAVLVLAMGLAGLVGLRAVTGSADGAVLAPAGSQALFRLDDPRIDEASGIARGIRSPGVLYVQNDSGDSARFFALDATTGRTLAVYSVPGASNVDWEDLTVATDSRGVPSVWLADIGDNDGDRSEVRIYRVDEPPVPRSATSATIATSSPQVWRLRYPDGPRNAEALAVAPGGAAYVLDKVIFGVTSVFAVPSHPDPSRVQTLRRVASFKTVDSGTPGGPNPIGRLTVTGAALSGDGDVLAVRTYTDAYLWSVGAGGVPAAMARAPVRIPLPAQPQGEGITVDGNRLLIDSEFVGSTVWSVPLPALPSASPASAASPGPSASYGSGGTSPAGRLPSAPTSDAAGLAPPRRGHDIVVPVLAGAGTLFLALLAVAWFRRPNSRRRRPG